MLKDDEFSCFTRFFLRLRLFVEDNAESVQ